MKKKYVQLLTLALAYVTISATVFGCTAAPRPNVIRHQETTGCTAPCTAESGAFVIDNFQVISQALERLGVPQEELQQMIQEGKRLEDVLETKGIKLARFKKELVKAYDTVIDEGVKNDKITKKEGKMLKKAIKEKVMSWLNN